MSEFGETLRVARRAQGVGQEELAQRVGITQAALSRYEHGLREPAAEVVEKFADVLGVTPKLLRSDQPIAGAMAVDAHLRRRGSAPAKTWRDLEARLIMYRLHTQRLTEEVGLRAERTIPLLDLVDADPATAARITRMQ